MEIDLTESYRGCTNLVAEKIVKNQTEIECSLPKERVEKSIRINLEYPDTLYIIASDEITKKVIQVA
jgi:hypothetical protein